MMSKNKLHTGIHLTGLTIGLFALFLSLTVIQDEWSYDRFWNNADRVYKAHWTTSVNGAENTMALTTLGLANSLTERFPEVETYSRVHPQNITFRPNEGSDDQTKINVLKVDTTFAHIFDIQTLSGQLDQYTAGYRNIAISASFRDRYFKDANPVGQIIMDIPEWASKPNEYLITAVFADMPQNTHLKTDVLMIAQPDPVTTSQTGSAMEIFYYLLKPNASVADFEDKVNNWYAETNDKPLKRTYTFQPLTEKSKSSKTNLVLFGIVGALLLGIACINFINLHTAQTLHRVKETGVRKVMGASRVRLIQQFLIESSLYFFISGILALVIYIVLLPVVESFIGHPLHSTILNNPSLSLYSLGALLVIGLLASIYPAWILARLKAVNGLRKQLYTDGTWRSDGLRKSLVVLQFSLAVVVLISVFVIRGQMEMVNKKELGFNPNQLLHIAPIRWGNSYNAFKERLRETSGVQLVGAGMWNAWSQSMGRGAFPNPLNPDENFTYDVIVADLDFARTLDMELSFGSFGEEKSSSGQQIPASGHDADHADHPADPESTFRLVDILMTEHTANLLNYIEIGKPLPSLFPDEALNPLGVIKDLHTESLHKSLQATVIMLDKDFNYGGVYIRTEEGKEQQVSAAIASIWQEFYPNHLLQIDFVNEKMNQLYVAEQKQQSLVILLASLTLGLACLGVFGLITHYTRVRTKEIGIRKVLGASVSAISGMFSKDFMKLVAIGIIIGSPVAWWAMNHWLEDFAYRIPMEWWMFALAGSLVILIAILTVAGQAVRAAKANPVNSLRDE